MLCQLPQVETRAAPPVPERIEIAGRQRLVGEIEPRQQRRQMGARGVLRVDQIDDTVAVEVGRMAEDGLGAVVVLARIEPVITEPLNLARESTRGFLDVVLGVVANAERE